ncbi:MAG: arylsulfatase, partial [Pseudomonadota bacterium]
IGCSLAMLLAAPSGRRCSDEFGVEYMGWRAYRDGDWKLVFVSERFGGTGGYALYDLAKDLGETIDLSSLYPEKVAELSDKWRDYANRNNVTIAPMHRVNQQFNAIADKILGVHWATEDS